MIFDIIVFNQTELENALKNRMSSIALCDNDFILPPFIEIVYTAIGSVSASIDMTKEEFDKSGMLCEGFVPTFSKHSKTALKAKICNSYNTSVSSFLSSYFLSSYFLSSYFLSSYFMSSYWYEYEYEYVIGTSFSSYYSASYTTSYTSSYLSSYSTSYTALFGSVPELYEPHEEKCIMVNGYGINLI